MKKNFFIFFILLLIQACSQWNVVEMRSRDYTFIENGDTAGKVTITTDNYGLKSLNVSVAIVHDRICVADNTLKRIQVMDHDGDVELVIGSLTNIDTKKIHSKNFNFNTIGLFDMDDEGNLYVQNKLKERYSNSSDMDLAASYILVFNNKGELQYTLGQKGSPDIPFQHIESLVIDSEDRLFVVSHQSDSWSVYQYKGKRRNFYCNLGSLDFVEKEGDEEYKGKIETVKTFRHGERFLIAVAYYQDLRLIYRKLYPYTIQTNSLNKAIMTIPDPRNVLFAIVNDRLVCFWNIEGSDVRFMYCNLEGSTMKNVRLGIDYRNNYYTKIIDDSRGNVYSYSITKKGIHILQWE